MTARRTLAALSALALSGCTASRPSYEESQRELRRQIDLIENPTPESDAAMALSTPTEEAEQEAALVLMREAAVIEEKPMSELSMADTSRLRSIRSELKSMRMQALSAGRSSDHLSWSGLDAAMRRKAAE